MRKLTISICRAHPSPNFVKHNVRKTNLQPRLLYPPRILLTAELAANRTSTRTRSRTYQELAELVVTTERLDQENCVETIDRDRRNIGEYEG
jgi:hypothetical protein